MKARGVAPDEITYSSAISACGNGGEPARAIALLKVQRVLIGSCMLYVLYVLYALHALCVDNVVYMGCGRLR